MKMNLIKKSSLLCAGLICCVDLSGQESLDSMQVSLKELSVLSSYSQKSFDDPVSISTINGNTVKTYVSNQEFPESFKSSPSLYASKQGGGFGDSRMTLRGFDADNIAFLVNGVPVNSAENGSLYWSNWSGLADVIQNVQIQRGIGLSKLGLYSVGGTVNMITTTSSSTPGAWVYYGIGNDNFQKWGVGASTGELKNGWSATFIGTHTTGDGYVNATNFESWSYYLGIDKKFGRDHKLSLIIFGAPQWHNRQSNKQMIEDYDNNRDGIRMNTSYGYINGVITPTYGGYNKYHKPEFALNHYWSINSKSSLSSSIYMSFGIGGGKKVLGTDANRLQYNYKTGKPNSNTDLTPDGLIDYGPVMSENAASETGSKAVFATSDNSHRNYGLLSTYTYNISPNLVLSTGIDLRYYVGYHYDKITDLLGGSYFIDSSLAYRDPTQHLKVGDKVTRDYTSYFGWLGAFGQLQYNISNWNSFVSFTLSDQSYQRYDPGKYGTYSNQDSYPTSKMTTNWKHFVPISAKAGVNYKFLEWNKVFINGGYVTKAPKFENLYNANDLISNPVYEKIATIEGGYGFKNSNWDILLSAYYTKWMDKSTTMTIGNWQGPKACIPNIDALHKGLELQVAYSPITKLKASGFFSIGDWKWLNDVSFSYFDTDGKHIGDYNAYIKNIHVGNAPQTSAYLSLEYNLFEGFNCAVMTNYYGRMYADFSPTDRTDEKDRSDSWKMPSYATIDLRADYNMKINKMNLQIFGSIYNLLNNKYFSDATDGKNHDRATAYVWYGTGITWSAGIRIKY